MITVELCHRDEGNSATFDNWQSLFSNLEMSKAQRLGLLGDVNSGSKSSWPRP